MFRPRLMGLLLALITLLAYLPVTRDGFVSFDDQNYVTENSVVQKGLTWTGIKWAFTTGHASNWHPITWLSHMADCELFGLNPGAHHLINVLFHTTNVVLLFLLLLRLTGALWPAAFVAALFAWHPLHVESVAWISERKDVLSTFFALLALLAYTRHAQGVTRDQRQVARTETAAPAPARSRAMGHGSFFYWLALVFFALGLMAKPMLVTLPFVMLLLDCWPLGRIPDFGFRTANAWCLAFEKWPFFLLAAVSCTVTYLVQRHGEAVITLQQLPLNLRIANALISYEQYLAKMIWPLNLAVFYPLPSHLSWIRAMAATAIGLLGGISWLIWRTRRRCPYLLVGWLWFLGTLVPVIGLVQVGGAAMADRYTYFPLVGLFIAVTSGIRDLAHRFQFPKPAVIAAVMVLAGCLVLTENQLRYWRDSESLFRHTLAVTEDNYLAHLSLGAVFQNEGRLNEAMAEYCEATRLAPGFIRVHSNLGSLLDDMGRPEEALAEYRLALRLESNIPALQDGMGIVLVKLGRFDEALEHYAEAARLDPADWRAPYLMGKALLKQGHDREAIPYFRQAMQIDPDNFQVLIYLAQVLASDENPEVRDGHTALAVASKANTLTGGTQPAVLDALGMACAELGHFDDAQKAAQEALVLTKASGMTNDAAVVLQRLQLYQNHQPFRQTFTHAP